ncbi:Canalicular multispecific organic anion transporter 2, partial [Mortierella sp. AD094]
MAYFTAAITAAFLIEAFPRKNTKVQRLARERENLSDFEQANLFSRLSIQYFQRIVSIGATRPLTGDDLTKITPKYILTNVSYERLVTYWDEEKARCAAKNKQPSFFWTVLRAYKKEIYIIMLIRLAGFGVLYIPPMLFGQLLRFIDDYSVAHREGTEPPALRIGFVISTLMLFFSIASVFALATSFQLMINVGIQARAANIALIYRKALKLSPQAKQSCTLGEITNHMAVDAEKWVDSAIFMPLVITVPFELTIAIYLLYQLLGWCLFAGLAVFGVLMPIQAKTAKFMNGFQEEQLKWMDSRLRLTTELLSNIKIIKLYNWEIPMRKRIDALRAKELKALKGLATIRSILNIVFSSITLLMALFTFWVFAYYGGPNMTPGKLNSEIIFVSITLFGVMNRPLGMVAYMALRTIAVNVAMKRVQSFLLLEEIDSTVVRRYSRQPQSSTPGKETKKSLAVDIENGTFMWEKPVDPVVAINNASLDGERQPLLATAITQPVKPTLSNVTLHIPEGNLTAIVGRIGQGKSSLLSAIMGEMYKNPEGTVTVYGDLAYVPQQAWIINATVRDNILFGKPFDQAKYGRIIYAAGLRPDLEMLAAGDQTEIGERGINLSGGQKQRVSLARAAYQDADIYLLDDPLSAVDAHVDQHLWQNLIGPDGLLKNKTRLLVTHGIHHLEHVDQIVVLKDGSISEEGGYNKLMKAHGAFYHLIKEYSVGQRKHSSTKQRLRDLLQGKKDKKDHSGTVDSLKIGSSSDSEGDGSEHDTIVEEAVAKTDGVKAGGEGDSGELIEVEKMEGGRVGWNIVAIYAEAASYRNALICISLFISAQACHISTNFWLRYWVSDSESRERDGYESRPTSHYLIGYALLVVLYLILDIVMNYVTEVVCGLSASKTLYDCLLTRVLRMPMSFFDTTPMGRIVNRFSSDINSIDAQLPERSRYLLSFTSIIGGTLFVIAYSTPIFLVVIPPLIATYFWIQHYFIKSSSSLKRLNSVAKSPLYQHFSETLTGVSTIRVMKGLREQFILENEVRGDIIIDRFYAYNLDNRWLQIRLESLGGFTLFIASILAVWNAGELDPSLVGLALSYALNMINLMNVLVQTVNEFQNLLVSVERVDEYSQKPVEAPVETGARLPPNWPAE